MVLVRSPSICRSLDQVPRERLLDRVSKGSPSRLRSTLEARMRRIMTSSALLATFRQLPDKILTNNTLPLNTKTRPYVMMDYMGYETTPSLDPHSLTGQWKAYKTFPPPQKTGEDRISSCQSNHPWVPRLVQDRH